MNCVNFKVVGGLLFSAALGGICMAAQVDPIKEVEIPYKKFVLGNGLT